MQMLTILKVKITVKNEIKIRKKITNGISNVHCSIKYFHIKANFG